jgi:hypothetical protein
LQPSQSGGPTSGPPQLAGLATEVI